ncbi:MAG TPA: hypothetical protein VIP46_22635 [Pyrinomonadaceae bacterium]
MATGKVTVVNQSSQSHTLDDGTMIGAARTPEARREGVTLSERDRKRLVVPRHIIIIEPEQETVTAAAPAAAAPAAAAPAAAAPAAKSEGRAK